MRSCNWSCRSGLPTKDAVLARKKAWRDRAQTGPSMRSASASEDKRSIMGQRCGVCAPSLTSSDALLKESCEYRQRPQMEFKSGPAGTYHYWASTIGAPVPFRELAGAFVVDPPMRRPSRQIACSSSPSGPASRHLSSARCSRSTTPSKTFASMRPRLDVHDQRPVVARDGALDLSNSGRWRGGASSTSARRRTRCTCTASTSRSNSLGDGTRDQPIAPADRHPVVTQLLRVRRDDGDDVDARARRQLAVPLPHHAPRLPGAAAAPSGRRRPRRTSHLEHTTASAGMAGMILGVTDRRPETRRAD